MSSLPIARPVSKKSVGNSWSILGIVRWAFLALSIFVFLLSRPFDGFYTDDRIPPRPSGPGMWLLLLGWLGVLDGIPAWLANPALLITWLTMGFRIIRFLALACSLVALGFALSFLLNHDIMQNEGGARTNIVGYGPGYVIWITSMVIALFGCLIGLFVRRNVKNFTQ
ncbi:MAG: hypothetical protein U0798_09495 [Gemmataceae bacterium]